MVTIYVRNVTKKGKNYFAKMAYLFCYFRQTGIIIAYSYYLASMGGAVGQRCIHNGQILTVSRQTCDFKV